MPKAGQKSVTVSGKTLKELEKAFSREKEKHPNLSFASFISETALMELERQGNLQRSPYFSLVGFQENVLYLKDEKQNRVVGIYLTNGVLSCDYHNSTECIHIGFALALPEVNRRLHPKS